MSALMSHCDVVRQYGQIFFRRVVDPSASDFAALAVRRADREYEESGGLDREDTVVDGVDVDGDVGAVVVLDPQVDTCGDAEGSEVAVSRPAESDDVQLERGASDALKDRVEVGKRVVVDVEVNVRPVVEFAHSPTVGDISAG